MTSKDITNKQDKNILRDLLTNKIKEKILEKPLEKPLRINIQTQYSTVHTQLLFSSSEYMQCINYGNDVCKGERVKLFPTFVASVRDIMRQSAAMQPPKRTPLKPIQRRGNGRVDYKKTLNDQADELASLNSSDEQYSILVEKVVRLQANSLERLFAVI